MRDNGKFVNNKGYIVKHQNHIFRTAIFVLIFASIASIIMAVVFALLAGRWVLSKPDILFDKIADRSGSSPDNLMDWLSVILSYIGAILGGTVSGIVAIVGVYWTINYERNKDHEEKRIQNMPMLTAEAYLEPLTEKLSVSSKGGIVRLHSDIDYELLKISYRSAIKLKEDLLERLDAAERLDAGSKESVDKSAETQAKYEELHNLIKGYDISKSNGLAEILEIQLELEGKNLETRLKKKAELIIWGLRKMDAQGCYELIPAQRRKKFRLLGRKKRLYEKAGSTDKRKWTREPMTELAYDCDKDMYFNISLENSGGLCYMQQIIGEDGQVWECDFSLSSKDNMEGFNIITEKNVLSKVGFWIKYKDVFNNSYYQKFTLHPWFHIPGFVEDSYPPERLETEAPYLEV